MNKDFVLWRDFILEAELKHSAPVVSQIVDWIEKSARAKPEGGASVLPAGIRFSQEVGSDRTSGKYLPHSTNKFFEIPRQEIYYGTNPKIKNGAVMSLVAHELPLESIPEVQQTLASLWDSQTRQFNSEAYGQIVATPIKVNVQLQPRAAQQAGFGIMESNDVPESHLTAKGLEPYSAYILVNPMVQENGTVTTKILPRETIETNVRHELQHLTQFLNTLALEYSKKLAAVGNNFQNLKLVTSESLPDMVYTVGRGKETKQEKIPDWWGPEEKAQAKRARSEKIAQGGVEAFVEYVLADQEYEPWLSDLADIYFRWYIDDKQVNSSLIDKINQRSQYDLDSLAPDQRSNLLSMARTYPGGARKLVKDLRKTPTYNSFATSMVRQLNVPDYLQKFMDSNKGKTFSLGVMLQNMPPNRKRELMGDLIGALEKRLRNLKTDKEENYELELGESLYYE
jgi:hypothetical protein